MSETGDGMESLRDLVAERIGRHTPLYADPNNIGNFLGPGDATNRLLADAALAALRDAGYSVVKLQEVAPNEERILWSSVPDRATGPVYRVVDGEPA